MQNFEIEFNDGINPISCRHFSDHFSPHESQVIDNEIQKLLNIGVIKEVEHHPEEFISPIFVIPKKDGEYRMILNLKELNSLGGRWNELESTNHINYLELLAVSHGLKSFCKIFKNLHVQIKSDNTSCISNISNMGSIKSEKCNILARSIWWWCIERNIWLSATFVPGFLNEAELSRGISVNLLNGSLVKAFFQRFHKFGVCLTLICLHQG